MATFLERREWAFDEDDDPEEPPRSPIVEAEWPYDEPAWLGFLKALGVGILLITLFPVILVGIVLTIEMVMLYIRR